jgi:hypothetical protein
MKDILVIFSVGDTIVGTCNIYSKQVVKDFCTDNVCEVVSEMEFTAFIWVEVK